MSASWMPSIALPDLDLKVIEIRHALYGYGSDSPKNVGLQIGQKAAMDAASGGGKGEEGRNGSRLLLPLACLPSLCVFPPSPKRSVCLSVCLTTQAHMTAT